jgi:hypothetical protein
MNSPTLASLLAIDTETGGAGERQCLTHALLSVGLFAPPVPGDRGPGVCFERFILPHPGLKIDLGAVAVNGYSVDRWEKAAALAEGNALTRLVGELAMLRAARPGVEKFTMVAHNAGHDRGFLECALERHGLLDHWQGLVSRRWECSMAAFGFAQRSGIVPAGESASLDALTAARLGITVEEAAARRGGHGALKDAELCWHGYAWLLEQGNFAGSPRWLTFPRRDAIPATGGPTALNGPPQRPAVPVDAPGEIL